jgi:cell division protein FtsB
LSGYHLNAFPFQISGPKNMTAAMLLAWVGTACWAICFWWMHRISVKQEILLKDLHEVTKRIEKLSKAEHDLIQEVHPKVEEIQESVKDVSEKVSAQNG